MNTQAIRAAWAEWEAASRRTDNAHRSWKDYQRIYTGPKFKAVREKAKALWVESLDRTDAAREALAGLPDLEEVEAYEVEQREIAEANANQLTLF